MSTEHPRPVTYLTLFQIPDASRERFESFLRDGRAAMEDHPASLETHVFRSAASPSQYQYVIQSRWSSEDGFQEAWKAAFGTQRPDAITLPEGLVASRLLLEELRVEEASS